MKLFRFLLIPLLVLGATGVSSAAKTDEKSVLAVLTSGAATEKKAQACQQLAVIGGPKSVPVLAALLSDEELASYARTGLEVIESPLAGKALRDALPKLKGRLLAGVVTSLGVRGDKAAVPALQKLVDNKDRQVSESALTALAQIGTPKALATIEDTLGKGPAALRIPAAHAALLAAEQLDTQGKKKPAQKLLKSIRSADLPDYIKQAATY